MGCADPALGAAARDPAAGRRGVRRDRPAGRLEDARRAGRRSTSRRRPCARSSPSSSGAACSRTRTPRRAASRPRPATASTSTGCSRGRRRGRAEFPLGLAAARAEVEEALQATTEVLSQVTRLLALVSAPPLEAATVRHVEVLPLQPNVVIVVVITSTGGVSKQRYTFPEPVDPGLVIWAARLPARAPRRRAAPLAPASRAFDEPSLVAARARVPRRDPRRVRRGGRGRQLFVGGAAGLLDDLRAEEIGAYRSLMDALEKRAALLDVLGAVARPAPAVRPRRRRARAVRPARPRARRRDVRAARTRPSARSACSARCAWTTRRRSAPCAPPRTSSRASSRRSTSDYARPRHAGTMWRMSDRTRLLRAARRRARRRRRRDQEGVPRARAPAAPRRLDEPDAEARFREVSEAYEVLSNAETRAALRPLRPRRPPLAAGSRRRTSTSATSATSSPPSSATTCSAARRGSGRARRRRRAPRSRSTSSRRRAATTVEVPFEVAVTCGTATATASSRARTPRPARAAAAPGRLQQVSRSVVRRVRPHLGLPGVRGPRRDRRASVRDVHRRRPARRGAARSRSRSRPASTTGSASASRARATRARSAAARATSTCRARPARRALRARGQRHLLAGRPDDRRRPRSARRSRSRRSTARSSSSSSRRAARRGARAARPGHAGAPGLRARRPPRARQRHGAAPADRRAAPAARGVRAPAATTRPTGRTRASSRS